MGMPADYVDVAERIRAFRAKYPDGSLQQIEWGVREISGKAFVYYTAAAYRTPDDARPGIGTAWEPFPGPTSFTRDSELMNAETSAWGRAIIAAGAADAKRVASADEVRNRQAQPAATAQAPAKTQRNQAAQQVAAAFPDSPAAQQVAAAFPNSAPADVFVFEFGKHKGEPITDVPGNYLAWLLKQPPKPGYEQQDAQRHAIYQAELDRRSAQG